MALTESEMAKFKDYLTRSHPEYTVKNLESIIIGLDTFYNTRDRGELAQIIMGIGIFVES